MLRPGKLILQLVMVLMMGIARPAGAQELAVADASKPPQFLLASASRLVRLDADRTPLLARRLELNLDGVTLKEALAEITRQAGLRLAFSDNDVPLERRVHLRAEAITVAGALTDVLLGMGVDVVFGRDGGASLVKRSAAVVAQPGRVVGQVTQQSNGQGLAGVEVLFEGARWRTLTREDGRYVLAEVEPGSYTITARRIGYLRQSEPVTVGDGQEVVVDFALQPAPTTLSEVVVTAERREERLIEVPQSVAVLTADELAKIGAVQFRDFANRVPGLTFATAGTGFTQISLRGVTVGLDVAPTVRVYVDEVPYGSSGNTAFTRGERLALDVGLFDMDRIEVLKGPQGTLYGASSMGGVLKYVTRQPNSESFGVDAQTGSSGTSDGGVNYNAAVTVNAPIVTDKAALRASGFYSRDGGYVDNLALGREDVNRSDVYGGRVDLLYTPADRLSIRIGGFLQDVSRDGMATVDYNFVGAPVDGSLDQRRLFDEPFDQQFRLASGTVTYDLSRASLTSVSSYQTVRSQIFYDGSPILAPTLAPFGGPFSAVGFPEELTTNKFIQEVRLASEAGRPLEWLIGGFYTHETSDRTAEFVLRDSAGQPAPNDLFTSLTPSRYTEYAAFGDLTWYLTSKFSMTGGIRYARNRQSVEQNGSGLFITPFPTRRSREDVVTYLANARYAFSDNANAYLRYATGYRPGGPNFVTIDPATGLPSAPPTFESDELQSYEIGFKGESKDRRAGLDVAAYYIDWKDMQVFDLTSAFGGLTNAPAASVRGVELAVTVRPTSVFTVTGAFAYQDGHISEAAASLGAAKGERLPNVPHITGALNADYAFGEKRLRPTVGATVRYMDDRSAGFGITTFRLPNYTTVDLRTGLTFGAVNGQLYVRNLFDERGQLSTYLISGVPQTAILQPRNIGVIATIHF